MSECVCVCVCAFVQGRNEVGRGGGGEVCAEALAVHARDDREDLGVVRCAVGCALGVVESLGSSV